MAYTPTPQELALLHNTTLFQGLSDEQLQSVLQAARYYELERRGFFFHQGEPATTFYVILRGNMRLAQLTPEGRQVIMHYFGPGNELAVIVVLSKVDYPVSAEAATDAAALGWDHATALALMEQFPRLAINGMEMVAGRFWELQNRYRELATERVEQRVARAVIRLIHQHNGLRPAQSVPQLTLTRQDLAEMTGTTLFTVSRICSSWEQRGLLDAGREQLIIHNLEDLIAIADDMQTPSRNGSARGL
ncbi:MAG: Crp/Fnr family transcriptional regulator [Anaerolineales bacterium]|nr:Crp/Fnr family transcriptional regulator [Anaerolineales bacterium]